MMFLMIMMIFAEDYMKLQKIIKTRKMICPILCDNGKCNTDKLNFCKLAPKDQLCLKNNSTRFERTLKNSQQIFTTELTLNMPVGVDYATSKYHSVLRKLLENMHRCRNEL